VSRGLVILAALALCAPAGAQGWAGVDADGDPIVVRPALQPGEAINYRTWTPGGGLRWGWIETEPSGDWRQWDSTTGLSWGRIEVEK
jgi:hypothetical protein